MAISLKTKLLSPKRELARAPSRLASKKMKIGVFLYLVGWIFVVALIGFFFIANDAAFDFPSTSPSPSVARGDGGVADASPTAAASGRAAGQADAGRPGPSGPVTSSARADGGAAAGGKTADAPAKDDTAKKDDEKRSRLSGRKLFIWVVLLGVLGGALHGLSSAAVHIGRRRCYEEWLFFYLSRPFVGGGTATVLYLLLRGGLAGLKVPDGPEGEFALMAWAAMAGLFSTVAMQKLRDIFDALFRPNQSSSPPPSSRAPVGGPASPLPPAPVQKPTADVASPPEKPST